MRVCGRVFQCAKLINLYGITKKSTLLIQLSFLKLRILTRIVTEHHGFLFLVCRFNGISQFSQDYICSVILRGYRCEKNSDICVKACQLANSHGLSLSITDFFSCLSIQRHFSIFSDYICSVILRDYPCEKKLGHPCENPSDTAEPFSV